MNSWMTRGEFDTWTGHALRKLRRRHNEACVNIIAYHSIAPRDSFVTNGTTLRHDPAEFERHVDYLCAEYSPVRLSEVVEALESGRTLRRAVVLTFDDGYADAVEWAMPILMRRRVPMTIFPVTSVLGNVDLAWQHKLTWLVRQGLGRKVIEAMSVEGFPPAPPRQDVEVYARRNYRMDLPEILEALVQATGTTGARIAAKARLYLEPEDVAAADPDLVEFGNHTHTHAILSALDVDDQRRELLTARQALTSLTKRPPIVVAYPFGLRSHYTAESKRLVAETGHRAALDARRRINRGDANPLDLSRKPAPCGSQEAFEKLVEDWPVNAFPPAAGGGA